MKLRIKGNSIRLRLTKTDVANLCEHDQVDEATQIGSQKFTYRISTQEANTFEAILEPYLIHILIPKSEIVGWETNDKVGFEYVVKQDQGQPLQLLIEKDFTCLVPRAENETDNYPNPKS